MHEHGSIPQARQDGLLVEKVGEELLIYDQDSHIAHCLSPIAGSVWRHCDGEREVTELIQLAGVSENLVADALHELREKNLLDADPQLEGTVPGISRREAIVRGVRISAAAAAVPLIVSATAPTPAMAESFHCVDTELEHDSCCRCVNLTCASAPHSKEECEKKCTEAGSTVKEWWIARFRCP